MKKVIGVFVLAVLVFLTSGKFHQLAVIVHNFNAGFHGVLDTTLWYIFMVLGWGSIIWGIHYIRKANAVPGPDKPSPPADFEKNPLEANSWMKDSDPDYHHQFLSKSIVSQNDIEFTINNNIFHGVIGY